MSSADKKAGAASSYVVVMNFHHSRNAAALSLSKNFLVVIIDDDATARAGVAALAHALGYDTVTCASAGEYLSLKLFEVPSCVVCDVQMPEISGADLHRRLIEEGHEMPMIFMSANSCELLRDTALRAGAIGFLIKPFSDDDLIACLEKAQEQLR